MSFIGKVVSDVVNDAKKGFEDIGDGLKNVAGGLGKVGAGILTGNGKEALSGLGQVGKGVLGGIKGAWSLKDLTTPEGLALKTALDAGKEAVNGVTGKQTIA